MLKNKINLTSLIWNLALFLVVLALAVFRHILVLTEMWTYILLFGAGLMSGLWVLFIDKQFLTKILVDNNRPVTESLLFFLLLIPVSLFVVTSSGSPLGAGIIIGLWMSILIRFMTAESDQAIISRYLYQLKKPIPANYLSMIKWGLAVWILILIVWVLF